MHALWSPAVGQADHMVGVDRRKRGVVEGGGDYDPLLSRGLPQQVQDR